MPLRTLAASLFLLVASARAGWAVDVATVSDLRAAIDSAQPGTTIHLANGLWKVGASVATKVAGTADKPITITADSAAGVRLDFSADEGLVVAHPYWVVEKVWLNGVCSGCASSGIHLQPGADHLIVRYARITNFATGIKAERTAAAEVSDVVVQGNELYNDAGQRAAGSAPLEIVGGKRWLITSNFIHDYGGTATHPGLAVRGGAADLTIEQNLIAGAKTLAAAGSAAGLSLGGAGTPPDACATDNRAGSSCACEVSMGIVRNNIIAHGGAAGLEANLACGTKVENNNFYDTTPGCQLAMAGATPVDVRYNVFSGAMVGIPAAMNLASVTAAAYKMVYLDPDNLDFYQGPNDKLVNDVTPGNPDAPLDYTGLKRKATNDWGAMELPATIHTWPWAGAAMIGAGAVPTMEIPPGASIDAGAVNDAPAGGMSGAGGSGGMSSAGGDAGSGAGGNAGSAGNGSGGGMTGAAGGARGGASSSGGGCSTGGEPVTGSSIAFFALILTSALLWLAHRRRA